MTKKHHTTETPASKSTQQNVAGFRNLTLRFRMRNPPSRRSRNSRTIPPKMSVQT